jgi:hypothetical protein
VRWFLAIANVVPNSPILVTLMMEALRSSETSVLKIATRRNVPEDGILHSHRRENLKSYIALTGWALQSSRNVSPVKYDLGFYIPEDGARVRVFSAGLLARSQFASGRSCDRPTRTRFSVVFLGPRANSELVPKFHVALYASHAALQMVISKFSSNAAR